jgi:hypothetical protein
VKTKKYLVVNANGGCKLYSNRPDLGWDEVAVQLDINIPDQMFRRPAITASLTIGEDQIPMQDVTVEMVNEIQELVLNNLGVSLKLVQPE